MPEDRIAPKGKFRILAIDKFGVPGESHRIMGDVDSLEQALALARQAGREVAEQCGDPSMATVYYVYDDNGDYKGGDIYKGE